MKKIKDPTILNDEQLSHLLYRVDPITFNVETCLFYEDHVPHAALVLIQGSILIYKKRKLIHRHHKKGLLIGWMSLLDGEISPYSIIIPSGTTLILVGKADVKCLHLNELREVIHA